MSAISRSRAALAAMTPVILALSVSLVPAITTEAPEGRAASNRTKPDDPDRGNGKTSDAPRRAGTGTSLFEDVTRASGIAFEYRADVINAKIIATMGGGAAAADFDNDGDVDLFLTGSVRKLKQPANTGSCGRLYRNRGNGTFEDWTGPSAIVQCGWGFGAYWADLDNDGWLDLYVTNLGSNDLWRNEGEGRPFRRILGRGLPDDTRFSIAAAFLDANGDGRLDVFVGNYIKTTIEEEIPRPLSDPRLPDEYEPPGGSFHLQGPDGSFEETTARAGVAAPDGRTIGAIAFDYDGDGTTDLYLADDQSPNYLFRGRGDGSFEDVSVETGTQVPLEGRTAFGRPTRSGMGLAVADYDRDGWSDLFVTNYANEPNTLYRSVRGKLFEETDEPAGLAEPSIPLSKWGTHFLDVENDGWPDLFVSNGQILPRWLYHLMRLFSKKVKNYNIGEKTYRQKQHLYRNRGDGTFELVAPATFGDLGSVKLSGRGSAAADLDGDGLLDLVLSPLSDPVHVYRNRCASWKDRRNEAAGSANHWIEILPVGSGDGRTPLHAKVKIDVAGTPGEAGRPGPRTMVEEFTVQPSYASGSYLPIHFGLGAADRIERITIVWPEGDTTSYEGPRVDRAYRVSRRDGLTPGLAGPK